MSRYRDLLMKCAQFSILANIGSGKKHSKHLGYMLRGDWAITEEPNGVFTATHLNGKILEHTDLKHLKETVMRQSGYRRNEKGLWQRAKIAEYVRLVFAGIVEDLKKKHPTLTEKIDALVKRDPTKKYLAYEVKILASGQALEGEIADVIELFHKFKDKLEKKDINQWNFTELRDKLFELRDFGDKSKTQQNKKLKEEIKKVETTGAEKLYEDDQCELVYVANKAQACFYGKGTSWCITMENEQYFEHYQSQNVVFYYVLRKDLDDKEPAHKKIAISVQRDENNQLGERPGMEGWDKGIQFWLSTDEDVDARLALLDLKARDIIVNLVKQDAPTRPMGFLAKMHFKPDELTFDDYAKNMDEYNKHIVASKCKDPRVLAFLAKDQNRRVKLELAGNPNTPSEVLTVLLGQSLGQYTANHDAIVTHIAENPSTSPEALELIFVEKDEPYILALIGEHPNTPPDILRQLSAHREPRIRAGVARNTNAEPMLLIRLADDPEELVRREVAQNPEAPYKALLELAQDYDVRNTVFNNPNLPEDIRKKYWPNANY